MNAQNAHDYIPLIQALGDGKTIELDRNFGNDKPDWNRVISPNFGHDPKFYRVKPEPPKPREWFAHVKTSGDILGSSMYICPQQYIPRGHVEILVREVLPETP